MLDFSVLLGTSYGLGLLILGLFHLHDCGRWALLLGLVSVPPLLVALEVSGISVQHASQLIACVAAVTLFSKLIFALHPKWQNKTLEEKKEALSVILQHPLTWGILAFIAGDQLLHLSYHAQHWDEYSYWLLTPKQMAMFTELSSPHFPVLNSKVYLPSIPILQCFLEFLSRSPFDESHAQIPTFLFMISVLPILSFNLERNIALEALPLNPQNRRWQIGSATLFVLFFATWDLGFKPTALVEPAFYIAFGGLLLLMVEHQQNTIQNRAFWCLATLLLIGGYYVKQQLLLGLPAIFAYAAFQASTFKESSRKTWLAVCISGFTFIFFASLWWWVRSRIQNDLVPSIPSALEATWQGFKASGEWDFLFHFFRRSLQHFTKDFAIQIVAFSGLILFWKHNPKQRGIFFFMAVFLLLFMAMLIFVYLTKMRVYEAQKLTSIDRYYRYFSVAERILGVYLAIVFLTHFYAKHLKSFFEKRHLATTAFFLIWGIGFSAFYWSNFPSVDPIKMEIERLKAIDPQGNGALFAQKTTGMLPFQFQYYTVDQRELYLRVKDGYSYYPTKRDEWTTVISRKEMSRWIDSLNFIWVHRSDEFIDAQLKEKLAASCPRELRSVLLVRNKTQFDCISLVN